MEDSVDGPSSSVSEKTLDQILAWLANGQPSSETTINLPRNHIVDSQVRELVLAIQKARTKTVHVLQLEGNMISDDGAAAIGEFLASDHNLERLDVSFNKIQITGCEALARGLCSNQTLKSLSLTYNNIDDRGAEALAAMLKHNQSLNELYLYKCHIADDGIVTLMQTILSSHPIITTLDLGSNRFGTEALQSIALVIRELPTLQSLSLRICDIRATEMEDIAEALSSSSLTHLDLRNNKIEDRGAKLLAAAIPTSRLVVLDLQRNAIGRDGFTALLGALQNSIVLTSLNLKENKVGTEDQDTARELLAHLQKNVLIAQNAIELDRLRSKIKELEFSVSNQAVTISTHNTQPVQPLPNRTASSSTSSSSSLPWIPIIIGVVAAFAAGATVILLAFPGRR